jgi:hypothetical protein
MLINTALLIVFGIICKGGKDLVRSGVETEIKLLGDDIRNSPAPSFPVARHPSGSQT